MFVYKRISEDCTYPFGFDPAWAITSNDLSVANGIKMKLSVIFAIFHMTIGVLMKGTNTIHHKHWPHFFAEVVTGLIILEGLFGWMDYLVFAKWFIPVNV
jgi:V-type H+-transporting ATPase subunit a